MISINCFEIRMNGIERGHRILEDHRDALAADLSDFVVGHRDDVLRRRTESRPPTIVPAATGSAGGSKGS